MYHLEDNVLERSKILYEEVQQQKYNDERTSVMYVVGLRKHRDRSEGTRISELWCVGHILCFARSENESAVVQNLVIPRNS